MGIIPMKGVNMIFVPHDLIRNPEFTALEVAIWCLCDIAIFSPMRDFGITSVTEICFYGWNTLETPHSVSDQIPSALQHLFDSELLVGEKLNRTYYKIDKGSFDSQRFKNFVKIDENDIYKIFREHKRPFSILRHYLLMLSTINNDDKSKGYLCGIYKNETIAEILGQNETTITGYTKALEKLGLLYIYRGVRSSNTYGRPEDKDTIIAYGQSRNKAKVSLGSNHRRKMTQMYNQIKNGKKYDEFLTEEIYNYCSAHNEREHELQEQNPKYVPNLFDLSVIGLTGQS